MKIKEVVSLIDGAFITGSHRGEQSVKVAFASDLMSDVLTIKSENLLLLTGLVNVQAIRTAEMSDICCIVFARNKNVSEEMVRLAEENDITVITSPYSLFRISGLLYQAGLAPVY